MPVSLRKEMNLLLSSLRFLGLGCQDFRVVVGLPRIQACPLVLSVGELFEKCTLRASSGHDTVPIEHVGNSHAMWNATQIIVLPRARLEVEQGLVDEMLTFACAQLFARVCCTPKTYVVLYGVGLALVHLDRVLS